MRNHGRDSESGSKSNTLVRDDEIRRWLRARELGHRVTLGHEDRLSQHLYSSVETTRIWDPVQTTNHQHHGGIFNFDFSKDGSLLVAACEKQSVLMFDPLNGRLVASKDQAHSDCVNCVRFLDSRLFATCSDDTTVNLWDVRYIKHKIRTLTAHSNWVKNIEFDASAGLLVTSGFDGSIFTWDINRYSESEESYKRVFHTSGLMRMKLTPDASKLVVATGSGYLMVIHDLDLLMLSQDLSDFLPNKYRLMQQTNSPIPKAYEQNHVFTQTRNRVELISDFPTANKADMIASLEVHPQGWCVVSRNTSAFDASEWTCVHDIQSLVDRDENSDIPGQESSAMTANDQEVPHSRRNIDESQGRTESSGSTEPSRTAGSPAFVLSISINERTGSPPSISQTYSTSTGTSSALGLPNNTGQVDPSVEPGDLLRSGSAQLDLSQPIAVEDELDNAELEDVLQHNPSLSEMDARINDQEPQSRQHYADATQLEQQTFHHVGSGSSVLNVPNSSPSSLPSSSSLSSSSSRSSRLSAPPTGRTSTPRSRTQSQHQSTVDVHPKMRVSHASPPLSTFQARWNNPNDSAFMPSPSSVQTPAASTHHPMPLPPTPPPAPPNHSSVPGGAGLPLGESLTVLIRSRRKARLLLLGQNTNTKSRSRQPQPYIHTNHPRLTHYVEELNVGHGFIKEVAFSGDGRLICSPFGFGVRLLAFDQSCSEMCDVTPHSPVKLYEVASTTGHQRSVVTTKFSPIHCMFVSGCLAGKINFNQPRL